MAEEGISVIFGSSTTDTLHAGDYIVFAARTASMKPSAIRELLKVANRPGMVSFAGGLPAAELFPIVEIEAVTQQVLREHGRRAMRRTHESGARTLGFR